jgi:hypothetical protein
MRQTRVAVWMAVAILAFAGVAQASTIDPDDPQIIIRGGGSGNTIFLTGGTANITFGPSQVFSGPGGCFSWTDAVNSSDGFDHLVCGVVNVSGGPLAGLTFNVSPGFQLPLTLVCSFCTSITHSADGSVITFLFPNNSIPNNWDFTIEFVGFAQGSGISFTPVPEPGTLLLLTTGLGVLGLRRRRQHSTS